MKPAETIDPFSDDSTDTIEYFDTQKLDDVPKNTEPKSSDTQQDKAVEKQCEDSETKTVKDESKKSTDLFSEIIDLSSDIELDDLLPDINDANNQWKI